MQYDTQQLSYLIGEQGKRIQEIANVINQHRDVLLKMEQRAMNADQEKLTRTLAEIQVKVWEKASAYTNVIILAGYAGGFGIWTYTKAQLTDKANIWVATFLGISLIVFIGWEIFTMILRSRHFAKIQPLLVSQLTPKEFFEKLEVAKLDEARSTLWFTRVWSVVLFFAIGSASCALAILGYNFYAILMGWPKWPV